MAKSKKIRYAVVGLGHIAQAAVLPAFANAKKNSELVALVSDDVAKSKKLAKKYGVEHLYGYDQYEACLKSGLIDAVYICLPNHLHREYTEKAAKAGIHVLCEKPLAVTAKDAQAMADACERAGVKLMTAYRLHFEKANLEAARMAQSGEIGDLKAFHSTFAFQLTEDNIRLNDESKGGGPLHDIGIYCINATRYLLRDTPTEVFAYGIQSDDPKFDNIHDTVAATLRYEDGKIASFTASFSAAPVAFFEVLGTKGVLCLEQAYEYTEDMTLEVQMANGKSKTREFKKSDQFAPELLYFSNCILEDKTPEPGGREGVIDLQIIEALLRSLKKGAPVKLKADEKIQVPTLRQEIRRPAVRQPKIIHAKNPSAD